MYYPRPRGFQLYSLRKQSRIPLTSFSQELSKSLWVMTNVLPYLIQLMAALRFSMDNLESVIMSLALETKKPPAHMLLNVWQEAAQQLDNNQTIHASHAKTLLEKIKQLCVRYCGLSLKEPEMFE
jgi:hypothetical protein